MKQLIILLVSGLFLVTACQQENEAVKTDQSFVLSDKMMSTTTFSEVTAQPLKNERSFYGSISPDHNKMIEVYPVVGGSVTKVFVELGDYVKKGQLLATIRSTEVAGFEQELDDAKNDVMVAKTNLRIAQELYEGKLNAERDVLQAQSQLDKAQAQLQRIQETFKIYNIKKGAIYEARSPISGFVIEKNINENMLLRSDKTDNIFDIAEIDKVWAMANINESDINQVRLGMQAEVTTLSYPDKVFRGKVDKIFNLIDPDTKAMKVRIVLPNAEYLLKPAMRANIKLSYTEDQQFPTIPSSAIIFDKSKSFVMVFHDKNNIETRPVEVYRQVGDFGYIASGLKTGEKVITRNQMLIYDALND
ncbi:efflux RND transporter periplasmic adaptor subunit [Dyadobacter tibetensis]|uniref:efflux RND transporter periplasmic adaptor subunit n=1 Tax=Dyadobacter tibetensis TaxID=1211851 RepID=UPI00047037F6|nr:efflux RND transporter periplasmic adaptor subunit [Dyadobacter tibetensis]